MLALDGGCPLGGLPQFLVDELRGDISLRHDCCVMRLVARHFLGVGVTRQIAQRFLGCGVTMQVCSMLLGGWHYKS